MRLLISEGVCWIESRSGSCLTGLATLDVGSARYNLTLITFPFKVTIENRNAQQQSTDAQKYRPNNSTILQVSLGRKPFLSTEVAPVIFGTPKRLCKMADHSHNKTNEYTCDGEKDQKTFCTTFAGTTHCVRMNPPGVDYNSRSLMCTIHFKLLNDQGSAILNLSSSLRSKFHLFEHPFSAVKFKRQNEADHKLDMGGEGRRPDTGLVHRSQHVA